MSLLNAELLLLWVAMAFHLLAGTLAIFAVILGRRPERAVLSLLVLALMLHAVAIGIRWDRLGHGPFITIFEILSSNVWSLTLVFTLAYWRIKAIRSSAAVVLPIILMMIGWLLTSNPAEGFYPPTYQTPLLYVHIFFGKVFLGSVLVAVGLAGVILLRAVGVRGYLSHMPDDKALVELAYRFMGLGLIFDSLMLVAGAIWAQDAWGRYWAWDALESWAFVTWLLLAFAIHIRVTLRLAPVVAAAMVYVVFTVAFLTFFGVPFISTAFHQGAV